MRKVLTGLCAIALFLVAGNVSAQTLTGLYATYVSTTATAEIVTPITIEMGTTDVLNFGQLAVDDATAGTCVLSPITQERTVTDGVYEIGSTGFTCADFLVSGISAYSYDITLPSSVTLTLEGGSATITVDNLTAYVASAAAEATTGTITDGEDSFILGGTLNVAAGQTVGNYVSDAFDVTVTYE